VTHVDGLLVVDKPPGITSHGVVAAIRRTLGTRKVGHAGTLDPAATGVLVVGIGRGTRLLTYLVGADKEYTATLRLGWATSTDDAEGERIGPVRPATAIPGDDIDAAMRRWTGPIRQVPSAVSAVKVDGRRAYDRVRAGADVDLPARSVIVHSLLRVGSGRPGRNAEGAEYVDVDVRVSCTSGTYVRALARDLGTELGCGAHVTALRRTVVGPFRQAESLPLDGLTADAAHAAMLGLGTAAARFLPVQVVAADDVARVRSGLRIHVRGDHVDVGRDEGGAHSVNDGDDRPVALVDEAGQLLAVAVRAADGLWRYGFVVV